MKYKGKYRVLCNVDKNTNDYPRSENGNLDTDDLYIKCSGSSQIYHYGHSTLVAYIPSLGRAHNQLITLSTKLLGEKLTEECGRDYEKLYEELSKEGTVYDIVENDAEVEFKFNQKDIELIAGILKAQTSGSNISPFSTRNLPKRKEIYQIPLRDLTEYRSIINQINGDNLLSISHVTNRFLKDILSKNAYYKHISVSADMKKKMLKGKEYIHSMGTETWNMYLKYLRENLSTK